MVFPESFTMSSSRVRQGPSPPTVEQILEDLSAASDEDVVFKSPVVVEHGNQTNNASSHSKEGTFPFRCFEIMLCTTLIH